jgi:uncharacterized protein YcaQ
LNKTFIQAGIIVSSTESITLSEAQNLVVRKQKLTPLTMGRSKEDIVRVVKDLCGVQYDPLPVIAQAHYLTLWNRVQGFKQNWLDLLLYEERKLIEFMLMRQTLNIVPIEELPYYFQGTRNVARTGWIQQVIDKKDDETSKKIVKKLCEKGEVSPKDFHYASFRPLSYSGRIFISRRDRGVFRMPHYRLFSEYFPNIQLDSVDEAAARKYLILKALSAYGVSSSRHIAYWIGYKVRETEDVLKNLEKEGFVTRVKIEGLGGLHWIRLEDLKEAKTSIERRDFVAFLTLIDNLVRDRKWLQQLFNYTFEVEYFQKKGMKWHVNIFYNDEFLGFIDPKFDRAQRSFIVKNLFLERSLKDEEWEKIVVRMKELAEFHDAETIKMIKIEPADAEEALRKHGFSEEQKGELSFSLR